MRKSAAGVLAALALLLVPAVASHAGGGHGGGGHGGGHGGGPGHCHNGHRGSHRAVFLEFPWWDPYLDPYWYAAELEVTEPSAIEESPAYQQPPAFWLYCPSSKAYYPTIKTCRDPWMKIPPPPQ